MKATNNLQQLVKKELSGNRAWQHANYVTQYMRTPGSSGIRETTAYTNKKFNDYNLDELYTIIYPSKEGGTEDLKFMGWDVNDASLDIVEPIEENITNYAIAPTCIQHWSIATPPEGVVAELVDVGSGVYDKDYETKNVKGKIVLAREDGHAEGNSQAYLLAVEKYGALGLVTDNLIYQQPPFRVRENHPDAISLLRVPSRNQLGWAFVISHTQGEYLRSLLKKGSVKLRAYIDATSFEGKGETLVGVIKGTEKPEQEIWFVDHNSGTKPGGNCAGGVGLFIENVRTITSLIKKGKIPKPKRTIRFIMGAEGGGLNAYLKSQPLGDKKVIAAFVYCSVGNDQSKCNSSLILYKSAESIPSFINDLCADTIEKVSMDALPPFKDETRDIKLIRFNVLPYTPWSDNSRLMRLMIPSPLFMSWPDQHFHTQFLTADKLDPDVLKRCGEVTTCTALLLANAGIKEAMYIANVVESKGKSRFMDVSNQAYSEMIDSLSENSNIIAMLNNVSEYRKEEINYLAERSLGALESIKILEESANLHKKIDELKDSIMKSTTIEKKKIESYKTLLSKEV